MKNAIQDGNRLSIVSGGAIASGAGVLTGALFGVAITAANASGQAVELALTGVYALPKATGAGTALTQGALVYWDATNSRVTGTATGNTLIGHCHVAAGTADATVAVRLQP